MSSAYFKRNSNDPMTGEVVLVVGNELPFKVHGLGSNRKHIIIESSHPCVKVVEGQGQNKGRVEPNDKNIEHPMTMIAEQECAAATLLGYEMKPGAGGRLVKECSRHPSPLTVKVLSRIKLPSLESDVGAIARLLLAESVEPGSASLETALESMRWMRRVLHNRLEFPDPRVFGITQKTIRGAITAAGQTAGFENYPEIANKQREHIKTIMDIANNGGDLRFNDYRLHVENALKVATGEIPLIADPCPTGLYAWRTTGSEPPRGNFEFYQTYAGQDFYTLTKKFLDSYGVKSGRGL
jgi:hypothetical protein